MFPLKYGRRQPKNARALTLRQILPSGTLPPFPSAYDSVGNMTDWQMLGNDSFGDCVAVTWATMRRIMTSGAIYPNLDQVVKLYKTQNPDFDPNGSPDTNGPGSSADAGMDIQTTLEYLHHVGGPDGVKVVAFARIDHTNADEVRAAIAYFRCIWIGANVTDVNEQQFNNHLQWTTEGTVVGGHSITGTGYGYAYFLDETWGAESDLDPSFMTAQSGAGVEEAWLVIWPEHIAGMSDEQLATLANAYNSITGKPLPIPVGPTPTPAPPPRHIPSHIQEIIDLWKQLGQYLKRHGWID